MTRALEILDEARESGLRVDCDVYPYTAGSTQLLQILPPWFLDGGAPAITRRLRDRQRWTSCGGFLQSRLAGLKTS